ncbi:MAG: hypothetical protein KAT25_10785 [Sulfuriflexus sp.]|nr:hypothetical protein [Pseudomonadota bacterium]MCK4744294.1 hypothetical protein [Sulfuriflexus sp.]
MQQLYIHLHQQNASWAICAEADCLPEQVESGKLAQLRLPEGEVNVVVFVPTIDVVLASASVPVKSGQRLAQAVPYALEEQLIDDIESLHVAIGSQDSDGKVATAVVSQQAMQDWLQRLEEIGVEPDVILPDVLALDRLNGDWSALKLDGDIVCVRSGKQTGFACDANNLAVVASSHASECEADPDNMQFTDCGGMDTDNIAEQFKKIFSIPVNIQPCNGDALATLISGYKSRDGINLLQGAFARKSRWLRGQKRWLPALVLLMTWLVLQFGMNIYNLQQLAAIEAGYKEKIVKVFKQAFPEVKRISDPQKQMAIKLKSLRGAPSLVGTGYLELMEKVSQVFLKVPNLEIKTLSFKNGVIDIDLQVSNLDKLESFKESILKVSGIDIDVKSTSQRKGKLLSRIQIRSRR